MSIRPEFIYVAELLKLSLDLSGLSQDGMRGYVNDQVKKGKLDKIAEKSKGSWSSYNNGARLPPLELLKGVSNHLRVPIAYGEFVEAWNQDRAYYQNGQLEKAEKLRLEGDLTNAQAIVAGVIREFENAPSYKVYKRALAKAHIIYSLIGTHTAGAYKLDRFLRGRLSKVERYISSLDPDIDESDCYFYDYGRVLPFLILYLKGRFNRSRDGVRKLIDELSDVRVKALALRNLAVSTARCFAAKSVDLKEYEQVRMLLDGHQNNPLVRLEDRARMLEGSARSKLILSEVFSLKNENSSLFEQALSDIDQAKQYGGTLRANRVKMPTLIEIQIARTELEIGVAKRRIDVEKVLELFSRLASAIKPGWDRYWEESQRLALATNNEGIADFEYTLRKDHIPPHT